MYGLRRVVCDLIIQSQTDDLEWTAIDEWVYAFVGEKPNEKSVSELECL